MAFRNPELNRLFQDILNRPRGQQVQPPTDGRAALARVLREQRRRARRQLVQ